jgi:Na+/proline symporter
MTIAFVALSILVMGIAAVTTMIARDFLHESDVQQRVVLGVLLAFCCVGIAMCVGLALNVVRQQ